ncbi:hypothetical protein GCM10007858_35430 [Bradyrhizobium liaoningense]|nr:hypothetical protein GCM10007858_35430 [Bradyrhizobium liaoningense]
MSLTWNPRLVKTPTPIMSATTMAVATGTETPAPLPVNRPIQAAVPACDAVIAVLNLRRLASQAIVQFGPVNSSRVNKG